LRDIIDAIRLRPKTCVWELTARCNMRCLHCASDLGDGRTRGDELSLDEALRLCHELKDLDCENVVLSGGEAILRHDWEVIARELGSLGINVSLISNGLLIDEAIADRIFHAGLCRVALSLDGLEQTHNTIRCNPHSFERVCRAFGLLKARGMQVNIATHVNRMNLGELEQLEDFVSGIGADVWRLQIGSPVGRLARHPELHIAPEQLPEVADFIVAAKSRGKVYVSVGDNVGYFSRHEAELRRGAEPSPFGFWCGCSAGCLTIGIEANGNIKGCLSLQSERFVEGNIRSESLATIWRRPGGFAYTRGFTPENLHGSCAGCEYGEICRGGCTFMAFGATGAPHNNPYCLYRVENAPDHANAPALSAHG
jgi:radical SAM protein with 4Fe4S-binding SPASM domain